MRDGDWLYCGLKLMLRAAVILFLLAVFGSRSTAAPTERPAADALAAARAEAVAMVRPGGPIIGQPVAFNPIPAPPNRFASNLNRYTFVTPQLWNPYWGYGWWSANRWGWGGGWGWGGWGWRGGWGGGWNVGASYQNSTGGVGW